MRPIIERALGAWMLVLVLSAAADARPRPQASFEALEQAAEAGEFARALDLARAEPDPLDALRAEFWVWYRARDFVQACATADRALELVPGDLWLAERATAAALWMRDPHRAARALERFEASWNAAAPEQRAQYESALLSNRAQAGSLNDSLARTRSTLARARAAGLAVLGAVLAGLAWLSLGLRRPLR